VATWNCAGAFRLKVDRALALDADVTLVQEAENPASYSALLGDEREVFWFARPQDRKGVLAFTRGGFELRPHRAWVPGAPFSHVIPLTLRTPAGHVISLFHVWTLGAKHRQAAYVGQAHEALDHYERLLRPPRRRAGPGAVRAGTVLVGDFNSNACWDDGRVRNHSALVDRLARCGIHSAYHRITAEAHGAETKPTFYLYRQMERPYHLDYCFTDLPVRSVEVGTYAQWSGLKSVGGVSDHVPVVATLDVPGDSAAPPEARTTLPASAGSSSGRSSPNHRSARRTCG
jgi:exodeoxyribonuclease III